MGVSGVPAVRLLSAQPCHSCPTLNSGKPTNDALLYGSSVVHTVVRRIELSNTFSFQSIVVALAAAAAGAPPPTSSPSTKVGVH